MGPRQQVILVVVKPQKQQLGVLGAQHRSEIIYYEISLVLCREGTGLPWSCELWLVLRRHGPDRHTFVFVCDNELRDVAGPGKFHLRVIQ